MYYYTEKVVIITGGTSGIGEASAIRFVQEGAEVVITGRNKDKGKALTEKITKFFWKKKVIFHELDIKNDTSIEKFKNFLNNNYEKVDVLFNNAGVFPATPAIENIDRDSLMDIFDTNIISLFMLTKAVLPLIKKARGGGVIINNASVAGLDGNTSGQNYAYAASKAGVIKFTKMMAKQYGEQFRTNCICPGIIETPIYNTFNEEKFKERIPMKRCGKPDDVAKIVAFLGSDEAGYINGAVIPVDGGMSL